MYMLKNKEKVFIPEPTVQKTDKVEKNEKENLDGSHHSASHQEA